MYGTLDWVNVAEVECGVIWTKHGTYTMLTPNTLYHTKRVLMGVSRVTRSGQNLNFYNFAPETFKHVG